MNLKDEGVRAALRDSSSRTFGIYATWTDAIAAIVVGALAAAFGFFTSVELSVTRCAFVAAAEFLGTYSLFCIVRMFVPYAIRVSFPDMLRIRMPFYCFLALTVLCAMASEPMRRVYADFNVSLIEITLTLLAVGQVVRFLQAGGILRLVMAYALCGALIGLSAFGLVSLTLVIAILYIASDSVRSWHPNGNDYRDFFPPEVADYFLKPIARARMKWTFMLFFFGSMAVVAAGRKFGLSYIPENLPEVVSVAKASWMAGVTVDGALVALALGVTPVFISFIFSEKACDTSELFGSMNLVLYIGVGLASSVFLLKHDLMEMLAGFPMHVGDSFYALVMMAAAADLVMAGVVLYVDVRCRNTRLFVVDGAVSKGTARLTALAMVAVPLVLLGLLFVRSGLVNFSHGVSLRRLLTNRPEAESLTLSRDEAMLLSLRRGDLDGAAVYARKILSERPGDADANLTIGKWYASREKFPFALSYAEKALAVRTNDVELANYVAELQRRVNGDTQ